MIVKILVAAYNEVETQGSRTILLTHFLTFHSQLQAYPDLIGLIDLIEESAQSKLIRFTRILRDLFNQDARKREFATSILKQSLSKDSMEYEVKDLLKETVDLKNCTLDLAFELEPINQNFDYSAFDSASILQLLMSSGSDYLIKKQSLD